MNIPEDVKDRGVGACHVYVQAINSGTSPKMAEMFACQQAPTSSTDRDLGRGSKRLLDQFDGDDMYVEGIVSEARRHGYNPNPNYIYDQQLASFSGDPDAFVPPHDAKAHYKRIIEKQGRSCDELHVKVEKRDEEVEQIPLGENIVKHLVSKEVQAHPEAAKESYKDLAQEMINRHGYNPNARDDTLIGIDGMEEMGDMANWDSV